MDSRVWDRAADRFFLPMNLGNMISPLLLMHSERRYGMIGASNGWIGDHHSCLIAPLLG